MKKRKHIRLGKVADYSLTYLILLTVAFIFFFPCLWLILASFSASGSIYSFEGFFPSEYSMDSFNKLFTDTAMYDYPQWFGNSLFIATMSCILGTFLTKLGRAQVSDDDSSEVSKLLKIIGDLERISDHSVNVLESAEEMKEKKIIFSQGAKKEMEIFCGALTEILDLTVEAFRSNDWEAASSVEPLEQVIDHIKAILRNRHINRLKRSECSVEAGFVWSDLLTDLERTSDHCSNIAVSIMDAHVHNMNAHQSQRSLKEGNPAFFEKLDDYFRKYQLPQE